MTQTMILQLFTISTVDHTAYVYTLGVCDINRHKVLAALAPLISLRT